MPMALIGGVEAPLCLGTCDDFSPNAQFCNLVSLGSRARLQEWRANGTRQEQWLLG